MRLMLAVFVAAATLFATPPPAASARPAPAAPGDATEGELRVANAPDAAVCPLEHTDVVADVSGFVARVTVTQRFANPLDRAIEAVYRFPLPGDAAVDRMTMRVG